MSAADTTRKGGRGRARANGIAGERLWKSRSVETQKQGFHCAWESRKKRGIPTFPQPRRRRPIKLKPDISCATKTGHFNLLTTEGFPIWDCPTRELRANFRRLAKTTAESEAR